MSDLLPGLFITGGIIVSLLIIKFIIEKSVELKEKAEYEKAKEAISRKMREKVRNSKDSIDFSSIYDDIPISSYNFAGQWYIAFWELLWENEDFWNGKLFGKENSIFYISKPNVLIDEIKCFRAHTFLNPFVMLIRNYASKKTTQDHLFSEKYIQFHNFCCSFEKSENKDNNEAIDLFIRSNIDVLSDPSTWKLSDEEFDSLLVSLNGGVDVAKSDNNSLNKPLLSYLDEKEKKENKKVIEYYIDITKDFKSVAAIHWIKVSNNYHKENIKNWLKEEYGSDVFIGIYDVPQSVDGHSARPEAYTIERRK